MNSAADSHEEMALSYLRAQLGPRAPDSLRFEGRFDERPLEGEGLTTLFSFDLPAPVETDCYEPRHYVASGETSANFYPTFGLSPDDAYSLHVGTRFMLEMQVQRIEGDAPAQAIESLQRVVHDQLGPGIEVRDTSLAALFRCEDGVFAVFRMSVGDVRLYALGGDLAPGFYEMCQHPPQVVVRLHLGKLIRNEARFSLEGRAADGGGP